MLKFLDILKTRYEAVLQSSSDSVFYQNIHSYFDYIVKTPELAELMDKAQSEYADKHTAIWNPRSNDENELDKREERTLKLERFNLYALSSTLRVRIYDPLEDYKTSDDDDKDQDPVAILMLKGINNSRVQKYIKESKNEFERWNPKNIKIYNRWYEGKRKNYEDELRRFHLELLNEVENLKDSKENILPKPEKVSIPLFISQSTGDFKFYKTIGNFPFGGKEFSVINTLYNSDEYIASYLSLIQSYNSNIETATKAQKDDLYLIIRDIKKRLNISSDLKTSNPDILKNIKNNGYRLIFKHIESNTE
ncbi:MAG: hypothetical protein JJE53_03455 [Candidatus Pacebacteria bacterium]|nr:hypothetical protein [Candidatus Paceibacterota bacterium]